MKKSLLGSTPRIVGCVATAGQLQRYARRLPAACDVLEVRLDLIGSCGGRWMDLCAAIQAQGMPVLLTVRDESEGGAWRGREAERLALYLAGLKSVAAVDMELGARVLDVLVPAAHRRGVAVVGSFHDFRGTPDCMRLQAVEARGRRIGVDIVKIATRIRSVKDLACLYALPVSARGPICVIGMGARGGISRIALPCAGSCLAYGSLEAPTAPGQISCSHLAKELARWGARKL